MNFPYSCCSDKNQNYFRDMKGMDIMLNFKKSKDVSSKNINMCFDRTSFCNCAGNDGFTIATRSLECDQQEILLLYPDSTNARFEGNLTAFNLNFG